MIGLILILTSLVIGVLISLGGPSAWLSYILVIIFVRGIMIIILYISSLSSNETINSGFFFKYVYRAIFLTAFIVFSIYPEARHNFAIRKKYFSEPLFDIIYKTYTQLINPITTLIIFYLLIVLVTAVNIVKTSKCPLRRISA